MLVMVGTWLAIGWGLDKPNGQLEVCAFDPSDPPGREEGMDTDSINCAYIVKPNKNSLKLR